MLRQASPGVFQALFITAFGDTQLLAAGKQFGDVLRQANPGAFRGSFQVGDTVSVTFASACPRNNLRTGETFLAVERFNSDAAWETVRLLMSCPSHFALLPAASCQET